MLGLVFTVFFFLILTTCEMRLFLIPTLQRDKIQRSREVNEVTFAKSHSSKGQTRIQVSCSSN